MTMNNHIIVYDNCDFKKIYEKNQIKIAQENYAIIEIYTKPSQPILTEETQKLFKDKVICIDFNDSLKEECKRVVNFVQYNMNKNRNFIIKCGSANSRSQQIAEYILKIGQGKYVYDSEKSSHEHYFYEKYILYTLFSV